MSSTPAVHPFLLSTEKHAVFHISSLTTAVAFAARKFRVKPSMVALLALLTLTAFCSLHQHLTAAARRPPSTLPSFASHRLRYRTHAPAPRPKLALAPADELASVVAFMAALRSNSLPDSVDPRAPLDPELVLDFDTRTPRAAAEVRHLVADTWARLPVVLLSKRYSPVAREIKGFLSELNLHPPPAVFDVDERADEAVLAPLLARLTGADLPVLLVAGTPAGPIEAIRGLNATGQLRAMVAAAGAVVDGGRKRKAGKRRVPA